MTTGVSSHVSPPSFGWVRALLSGLGIVIALAVLLVWVPELALTRLTGVGRSGRVTIATAWFFVTLGAAAWALRSLQARRII